MRRPILAAFAAATLALAACSGTSTPSAASSAAASPSAAAGGPSGGAGASGGAAAACAPSTSTPTVDATIADFAFHPDPVQAKVGDVIGWTNQDSAAHTATLDDGDCTTDAIANGATGALVFNAPGTYAYHCRIHPQMTGTIEVSG
jgi:plastocyanin